MSKVLKIVLIVCAIVLVLAVSGSMIYYYAFFRPRNETAKWEAELEFEKEKQEAELKKEAEELAKEEAQKREEKLKEIVREGALSECLNGAYENYQKNLDMAYEEYVRQWNFSCEELGRQKDCGLPDYIADKLNKEHENTVERYDKIYESDKKDCYDFWD